MRFSREEFDIMVKELLYSDKVRFDMLCHIANKTLNRSVKIWCCSNPSMQGREYEFDLMQNIQLRLIQTTVNGFLLRSDKEGPYNNDPEGFEDWMFKVARSRRDELFKRVWKNDNRITATENMERKKTGESDRIGERLERIESLKESLAVVLESDVSIYKTLTWLAHLVFIADYNVTRIASNELILAAFENKTLYEMYATLRKSARSIPWLEITDYQHKKIIRALEKKREDITYGDAVYKDFFMKHNGKISGKKSISDWTHRMNRLVYKKIG